jgi:hypothetical protein
LWSGLFASLLKSSEFNEVLPLPCAAVCSLAV